MHANASPPHIARSDFVVTGATKYVAWTRISFHEFPLSHVFAHRLLLAMHRLHEHQLDLILQCLWHRSAVK